MVVNYQNVEKGVATSDESANFCNHVFRHVFMEKAAPNASFANDNSRTLKEYLTVLIRESDCPPAASVAALIYLQRITTSHSHIVITANNAPRLFLVALMLASKFLEDNCFRASDWVTIAKVASGGSATFTAPLMNSMELELLELLGWSIHVRGEEFTSFVLSMKQHDPTAFSLPIPRVVESLRSLSPRPPRSPGRDVSAKNTKDRSTTMDSVARTRRLSLRALDFATCGTWRSSKTETPECGGTTKQPDTTTPRTWKLRMSKSFDDLGARVAAL